VIAPRCAGCPCQRYPERGAAKLAKLRLAQTDAAPFPAPGTADTARSTGFHGNGNGHCNGHCHCNGNGNGNGNGNCRCAYCNCNRNCRCAYCNCNRNCRYAYVKSNRNCRYVYVKSNRAIPSFAARDAPCVPLPRRNALSGYSPNPGRLVGIAMSNAMRFGLADAARP